MKILLTGATGFLGKNLLPELQKDYDVVGIGQKDCNLIDQRNTLEFVKNSRPSVVIHAAGSVGGIGANRENPGKFMYENLAMGTNLIEAARSVDVEKFIMLGTVCSYPKYTAVPFREVDLWLGYPEETNAPYGIAKKTLMKLLDAYHGQYGMKCVNLVPVNMYGPHDHFNLTSSHVIPALILKVFDAVKNKKDKIEVWGTGEASREFLYVKDCAQAIKLAIEKDVNPSPINIGTGKEIKIKDLVDKICDKMGFFGEVEYNKDKPDGQPRRCLSTWKAKNILDFEATYNLDDGLLETIEFFLRTQS